MPMLVVALFLSLLPVADTRTPPSELQRCADFLAGDMLDHAGVPAIVVSVRREGVELAWLARGSADEGRGTAVTRTTRFPIGSLTRVFTSAAVLQLVEKGELALDDEIVRYLPLKVDFVHSVRVRHVLEGTSGIAPWARVFARAEKEPRPDLDAAGMLALFTTAPFEFAPGVDYAPNSAAWSLLPLVIERSWGVPFARGAREHLLSPLGLAHTDVCVLDAAALGVLKDCEAVANAHDLDLVLARSPAWPAPSLCSTADDLSLWMEKLGQGEIVGSDMLTRMTRSARRSDGAPTGHGYALDLDELAKHPRWWHSGGMAGFRGRMSWYPSDRLAVAVLANCTTADVDALESELARFALGLPATRTLDLLPTVEEAARFIGTYQIVTTHVRFAQRGRHLVWIDAESERECAWQGRTRFVDVKDATFAVTFDLDGERAISCEVRHGDVSLRGARIE